MENLPSTASGRLSPDGILTLAANDTRARSQANLRDCLAQLEALCRGATKKEFAVELKYVFDFALSFGVAVPDVKNQMRFYWEALEGMPADMLRAMLTEVRKGWRWGNRLPLPAELKDFEPVEWSDRKRALRNVREALANWREVEPRKTTPNHGVMSAAEICDSHGWPRPPRFGYDKHPLGKRMCDLTPAERTEHDGWMASVRAASTLGPSRG